MQNSSVVRFFHICINKWFEVCKMYPVVFFQPYVTVYAGSFVKPAFKLRGIHPNDDDIFTPIVQDIRYIVRKAGITAGMLSHVKSVDPYLTIAEYTLKNQVEVLALVCFVHFKPFPIPSYVISWKQGSARSITLQHDM